MAAARWGFATVLDDLIRAGADVGTRTLDGSTAVHLARSADVLRRLVRHGADLGCVPGAGGQLPRTTY